MEIRSASQQILTQLTVPPRVNAAVQACADALGGRINQVSNDTQTDDAPMCMTYVDESVQKMDSIRDFLIQNFMVQSINHHWWLSVVIFIIVATLVVNIYRTYMDTLRIMALSKKDVRPQTAKLYYDSILESDGWEAPGNTDKPLACLSSKGSKLHIEAEDPPNCIPGTRPIQTTPS
jgi:hypothetical protein